MDRNAKAPRNRTGSQLIRQIVEASGKRPEKGTTSEKIKYASQFADDAATRIAEDLQPWFKGIDATTKRTTPSDTKKQQLDINFSTRELGLALGVSLKSVHFPDGRSRHYTHNIKRNLEELRVEAFGYHTRQPFAVMIAVLFLPVDSCDNGKRGNASSFGTWVQRLRPYSGRVDFEGHVDWFEKIFIAVYEPSGTDLVFFDVQEAPPKNSVPKKVLTYEDWLATLHRVYLQRNRKEFAWAGGEIDSIGGLEPAERRAEDPSDEE